MANFEIQKQKTITARIEKKSEIAKGTIEVIFTIEEGLFSFEPGQYVWVELLNLNFPDPRGTRRAFSIVSDPLVKNKLSIIFRISESGYKKTLISLPVGSDVHLIGPCGSFVLHDDIKIPTVFVAGGSGVASFFCIISNEILKKTGRELELFYFNDNEEKSPYLKELKDLERGSPFFKLHLFFGKLKSDDQTIVDLFLEAYSPIKDTNLYISGPVGMINIVDEIFSRIKIPSGSIHYEENYPSKHIGPENEKYFTRLEMFKQAVDQSLSSASTSESR